MAQRTVNDTKEMAWMAMPARKIFEPASAILGVLEMVRPPPAAWIRKVRTVISAGMGRGGGELRGTEVMRRSRREKPLKGHAEMTDHRR